MNEKLRRQIEQVTSESPQVFTAAPTVSGRVVHIDGDYLAYYCAGGPDTLSGIARKTLFDRIETTRVMAGADKAMVHLSSSGCTKAHRFFIATVKPYQGQRHGEKPVNWQFLRDLMTHYEGSAFTAKIWQTREADDGIALMAERSDVVIATRDKDMRMLPGVHVSWDTYGLVTVPRGAYDIVGFDGLQYGHKWFWLQMLQGDTADNIPGLPFFVENGKEKRIGDATAAKFLAHTKDNFDAYIQVRALYASYYGDAVFDAMAEQAALLWLRTDDGATIRNAMSPFPKDERMIAAFDKLHHRVEEQINAIACINGQG